MREFVKKHKLLKKIIKIIIEIILFPIMILMGVVLNYRKKKYMSQAGKSDSIVVLGRGVSLAKADQFDFVKDFLIVNTEVKELKSEPVRSLLKGKRIIHMVNIGEGVLPFWYLLKYNIYRYIISRLKPNGSDKDIYSPRKIYRTEKFGFKTDLLPEELASYLEGANNSGVIAVAYAAAGLKKKNVYVAGMDFYETPYMTGPLNPQETNLATEAKDKMINYITNLAKKCPDVNFYFITASPSFAPNLPNVKITRI